MAISRYRAQAGSSGCQPAIAMSGPTYQIRSATAMRPTIASTQRLKTRRRSLRMAAAQLPTRSTESVMSTRRLRARSAGV